jgi:hypothetical protein
MRYTIRRLRRKLANVSIVLGCWVYDGEAGTLGETVRADYVGTTLREVVRLCIEAAHAPVHKNKLEKPLLRELVPPRT